MPTHAAKKTPVVKKKICFFKDALLTPFTDKWYAWDMSIFYQNRTSSGQFAPGQSGNPGGRPKDEHRVAELARSYTLEAIDTLVELMRDGKDERVRGTAAQALLDRGWGKAKVEVVTGAEGSYLDVLRVVNEQLQLKRSDDWPENRIFSGILSWFWR
jgi:hypothetical protein